MADVNVDSGLGGSSGDGVLGGLSGGESNSSLPPIDSSSADVGESKGKMSEDEILGINEFEKTPVVDEAKVDEPVKEDEETVVDENVKGEEEDDSELIPEEDLNVAKITQFAKEMPELAAAFAKNPAMRNAVFAMARRSSKLTEYQTIIPTPEAAKFAAENSQQLVKMNEAFFSEEPQEIAEFWNDLYTNSLLKDPATGELVKDENGRVVPTGAYERVTGLYRGAMYNQLTSIASKLGEDDKNNLLAAIDIVKQYAGDSKGQPQGEGQPQLTQEQQRKLDEADKVLKQGTEQKEQLRTEWRTSVSETIGSTLKGDISAHVGRMVKNQNLALTQYEQRKIVDDIFNDLDKKAGSSTQYIQHFESLAKRAPLTEAGKQTLVAEARKYAKELLPSIAMKIIREATTNTTEKVAEVNAKRVQKASQKEVKVSGGPPTPVDTSKMNVKDKARVRAKELGRPLTESEILAL